MPKVATIKSEWIDDVSIQINEIKRFKYAKPHEWAVVVTTGAGQTLYQGHFSTKAEALERFAQQRERECVRVAAIAMGVPQNDRTLLEMSQALAFQRLRHN